MPPIAVAIAANGVDAEQGVVEVDQQLPHGRPARPGQRPQEVRRDPVEQPLGSLPISHGPNLFKTKGDHIFKVIVSGRLLSGIGFDDESKPSPPLMPRVVAKLNARVRAIWTDRKSVVSGKSGSVRVDLGGRRIIKKKKKT